MQPVSPLMDKSIFPSHSNKCKLLQKGATLVYSPILVCFFLLFLSLSSLIHLMLTLGSAQAEWASTAFKKTVSMAVRASQSARYGKGLGADPSLSSTHLHTLHTPIIPVVLHRTAQYTTRRAKTYLSRGQIYIRDIKHQRNSCDLTRITKQRCCISLLHAY